MAGGGLGKKKLQRRARQAEKRAAKNQQNTQPSSSSFPSSSSSSNNKDNQSQSQSQSQYGLENAVVLEPEEWFAKLKEDVFDGGNPIGKALDGVLRNTVRMTCEIHAPRFGSLSLLLGKNLAFLQLLVLDTERSIQGKLYTTGSKVRPTAPNLIQSSRKLFKAAVPCLLKDTEQWFFSRSLVFKGYTGVIDEAVKFSEYDPVGDLLELPMNASGIRCAEVFLFVAGDFEVNEDGLCYREAVKELLHKLNSKEGISKLIGFDCVAASVPVSEEKLEELKETHHISLIA